MRLSFYSILAAFCLAAAPARSVTPAHSTNPAPLKSAVVRLAPDFSIPGIGGKPRTLRSLRGQAVVLIFAKSVKTKALIKQAKLLQELYEQFASRQAIFAVALREGDALVPSNIPFSVVSNGAAVAAAYGVQGDFNIAIIGRDGNLDYVTNKVLAPQRVRDVVQNSFSVQEALRNH